MLTQSRTTDEIVLLVGQGNMIFIAARGTHEGETCAYVELYYVEAGKLVEHWASRKPFRRMGRPRTAMACCKWAAAPVQRPGVPPAPGGLRRPDDFRGN